MKLVFLDTKTVGCVPNLQTLAEFGDVVYYETTRPEEVSERISGADIVITNKVVLDENIIHQADRLKLICIAATGMNNVDQEAAREAGISVRNAIDYSSDSVAQGTFALLLHLINHISYYDNYVKEGSYSKSDIFTHVDKTFWELKGKVMGIIGLGNIGRKVAAIAIAFGSEVVYFSASGQNRHASIPHLELDELLKVSDIVSIHAPLNVHTAGLIDYGRMERMKRSAFLINVGRGGIIVEADLARAIDEGLIAGAGLDVFEREPIDPMNPLLHLKNQERIVLTPHAAWASVESRTLLIEKVRTNIKEFLRDQQVLTPAWSN